MAKLGDHIAVLQRFARSANVERDTGQTKPLDGYVVTGRALDVVERIATTAATGRAGGAWSITGPYGSGKSSLALLIDAALGPDSETRHTAWHLIDEASPTVGDLIRRSHQRHCTREAGFHRGLVIANREPLSQTVLRALHSSVLRSYGKIPPAKKFHAARILKGALADAETEAPRRTSPSPAAVVEIARCLAKTAPLLLIIDEFGKNLEAIQYGNDTDPYLLQQLAEAGQGSGLPIFLLTLQHLSFEDYLIDTDRSQRREWAKVQGRFEDITYVESSHQTRALIGTVFNVKNDNLRGRIIRWARPLTKAIQSLGIADFGGSKAVASCYPLHPLVALILPELCSRYGQHERTLFSFLTSSEPSSTASFLAATNLPQRGPLPCHGISSVYDYFVERSSTVGLSAGRGSRWSEIATRLRDAHGLSRRQLRLAKAIALLNLVSTTGTIRASSEVLALIDPNVTGTLSELEAAGLVTYRAFSDEYRIWQGTDIDIQGLLDAAHQQVKRQSLLEILSVVNQPSPLVAARHSAQHDMLRVFSRRYVMGTELIEPLATFSTHDGEVLLVVGPEKKVPSLTDSAKLALGTKPIIAAVPDDLLALDRAAREVAAIETVLRDPTVESDWVARRELGERLAGVQVAFDDAISTTFRTEQCRWILLNSPSEKELSPGRGSAVLSMAADLTYPSTPLIRNEMLNRVTLTSQGAKARRLLLEAMIVRGSKLTLGFSGYGPEVAMYRAALGSTGLHRLDVRNKTMVFGKPDHPSLQVAWDLVEGEFKNARARRINLTNIYAALMLPPVGMKAGVVPVFVTAALLAYSDEVAIYEHGTFKPILTPELSERMVRNPGHFDIKHFANSSGARRQIIEALAKRLALRPRFRKHRVANVLAIVGHLVGQVRRLDGYTRQTSNLSATTERARDVLAAAVEPDELLFRQLPEVFGLEPVSAEAAAYENTDFYAESVSRALDELTGCYDQLLTGLLQMLLELSAEASRKAITEQAVALTGDVLDPAVRPLVLTLANDSMETDTAWIKAVATVVAGKAASEWTDQDLLQFRQQLAQQIATFRRLVALHSDHWSNGDALGALRVTITRADGNEEARLVGIDQNQRNHVSSALDGLLDQLAEVIGSPNRARNALMALLGERLIREPRGSDETAHGSPLRGDGQHG